ncbi:hypothetical protein FHR48_001002 [Xanthomonas arboricola]|nr:hypothetical protein [Xanthomonas cannabis]
MAQAGALRDSGRELSGTTYWANRCEACGAIQGDHFVIGVNGPFFPRTRLV